MLESCAAIDDPGDEPSYLAVVPYLLRCFNPLNWPSQSEGTLVSDGETPLVVDNNVEYPPCGVDADVEAGSELEKWTSTDDVEDPQGM